MTAQGGSDFDLHRATHAEAEPDRRWAAAPAMAQQWLASTVLLAGDAATYVAAFALLALIPAVAVEPRVLLLVAAASLILFRRAALYPGYRLHAQEHLRRRFMAGATVAVAACASVMLLTGDLAQTAAIAGFALVPLAVQPLLRLVLRGVLRRIDCWGEPVVIVGPARQDLTAYLNRHWQHGLVPQRAGHPDAAVLVAGDELPGASELSVLREELTDVIVVGDLPGLKLAGIRLSDTNGEIGLRLGRNVSNDTGRLLRRALDLSLAVPAVIALAPLMLLAALSVWVVDPGRVLYSQPREGLRGRVIRVQKLRTMYRDAEERLEVLLASDPVARREWDTHFKLKDDPRILPVVGNFLRKSSCDELPQLWNILVGDMGLVGPRPFPEYHLAAMTPAFRRRRCSVTPGLTGLWQISDRSNADVALQQQLDGFYLENRSFWFDIHILFATFSAVFGKRGV